MEDQIKLGCSDPCLSLKLFSYIFFFMRPFPHFSSILLFWNVLNNSKHSSPASPNQCYILLCLSILLLLLFVRCPEVFFVFFDCCYPSDTCCPRAVHKDIQAVSWADGAFRALKGVGCCRALCTSLQWPWSAEEDLLLISQTPNNLQSGLIWVISCHL